MIMSPAALVALNKLDPAQRADMLRSIPELEELAGLEDQSCSAGIHEATVAVMRDYHDPRKNRALAQLRAAA